jgi:anti-sigma factor RsiW
MDCHRTQALLSPLIDGELPLDLSGAVLAHLEDCPRCQGAAESLRSVGALVRGVAEGAPAGLGARILGEAQAGRGAPRFRVPLAWSRLAAMLVGAASVAWFLAPLTPESSPSPVASRSGYQRLVSESLADLELAGSFSGDFRVLAARPEGRLLQELTGGRR